MQEMLIPFTCAAPPILGWSKIRLNTPIWIYWKIGGKLGSNLWICTNLEINEENVCRNVPHRLHHHSHQLHPITSIIIIHIGMLVGMVLNSRMVCMLTSQTSIGKLRQLQNYYFCKVGFWLAISPPSEGVTIVQEILLFPKCAWKWICSK